MADFDIALKITLGFEGGLVNNPHDPGGITNKGISLRFLQSTGLKYDFNHDGVIDEKEIINMDEEQAASIYRDEFWNKYGYGRIENQYVANYIFDMCVNMGPVAAHKCAQRALWTWGGYAFINDDGIMGDETLFQLSQLNRCSFYNCFLLPLKAERANYYRALNKPEFLVGWMRRAYSTGFHDFCVEMPRNAAPNGEPLDEKPSLIIKLKWLWNDIVSLFK